MKKILTFIFIAITYSEIFAANLLQTPPPPTPFDLPGVSPEEETPINFIVPFLVISSILFAFYIFKKNKMKAIS